ncbi:MAG: hypothetical protein HY744_33510 [Deltaproteobacteria bacterium]|nr:hypothetical protein [Deltaproteobacteria bacterium]
MALGTALVGASCGSGDGERVFDTMSAAMEKVIARIEKDSSWTTAAGGGFEVRGTLANAQGGEARVTSGWRSGGQYEAQGGTYAAFAEKLFVTLTSWTDEDINLTGRVVMTRHSMDLARPDSTDVSQTTVFDADLTAAGSVSGTFTIEVHNLAAGDLGWSCGTINDDPYGQGACY